MADPRPGRRRYEIALWIDRRIGPGLCALLVGIDRLLGRRRASGAPADVQRILLLKMWGMGSLVLASPLVERLRERHPRARIDFVSLAENERVLGLYPGIDRFIGIELRRGVPHFLADTLRTVAALRRERYDLLLDLEFFTRFSAVFSRLVGARRSHGFSAKGSWRGQLHDVEVPFNAYAHVASNFLMLLTGDYMHPFQGEGHEPSLPALEPPPGAWERLASRLASDPAWKEGRPLVVVNPNAGDMALERRWPPDRMAEFLAGLVAEGSANAVLIGSASEREYVASLVERAGVGGRVIDLAGRTDVGELVALLSRAGVVVTNDSGPMHLAAAAGARTVALFGPETPALYRPLTSRAGQAHRVHYRGLGCSPCMFVHDNKVLSCWFAEALCMKGIAAADVLASVNAQLEEQGLA